MRCGGGRGQLFAHIREIELVGKAVTLIMSRESKRLLKSDSDISEMPQKASI